MSRGFGEASTTSNPFPSPTGSLSLAEAKQAAFDHNWDLLAAKSGIDLASAQLIIAREFPNPTVSLSSVKIGTHEAATIKGNGVWTRNYDTIAAVSQLIEIAGKRRDRQLAARAGILSSQARFVDAKRTLDQGVTKAFISAALAEENARILTESAGYMRREADIAAEQFRLGDISDSSRKLIQINAEQLELQALQAKTAAIQARIAVEVLMAVDKPQAQWTSSETLEKLMTSLAPTDISSAVGAVRPDVLAAEADLRAAKANLQLQKALRIPDPTITVQLEHTPPGGGPAEDTAGFGITFPLPLWNRNGGNIKAAKASVDLFQEALGKLRNQAAADRAVAQAAYDEAAGRLRRYRDEVAPQSKKVRESVAYAFEKGAASLIDFLNAQQTDNMIRLAVAQAINDTAAASADLLAAKSVLTETELNSRK